MKLKKINRVFHTAFLQKLYCTCSSWYKIKIFFMKISSNPYFDDDVLWHEVFFLFLVKRHLFNTRFAISYQIVNIMEMFKILSWLIEEVTNWRVWNKKKIKKKKTLKSYLFKHSNNIEKFDHKPIVISAMEL